MQKLQARNIVKETFEKSFEKARFVRFIKELLNHIEESPFVYRGNLIPDAYEKYIRTFERVGKYSDGETKVDILIVNLKKETSLERARTAQRNFIAWYLNGSRGGEMKDAALVAFVSPNDEDWRFSLVKMEYKFAESKSGKVKVKEEFTPAKRWSFLVGKNENSHTAQSRLAPIVEDDQINPTLKQIEDAFNIEKVTKEFFEKYRELFLKLKESLDEIIKKDKRVKEDFKAKDVNTVDFTKKLLGQIVFLYFLQKKGWFGVERSKKWGLGSKRFLRELFEKKHGNYKNFFNEILEPLFYEALRLERSGDYYSRFDCRIPFLNGGLFDPISNYDWVDTEINIPNEIFSNEIKTKEGDVGSGILDIFDRYNFTVKEDEPLEKEVAVDPEMLGKVFENLLEVKDRKSKGTYYTPREIVHYMCQESLANYLATELENKVSKKDIETLIKYGESVVEHDSRVVNEGRETKAYSFKLPQSVRKHAKVLDEKLASIRVCDPAVGSGAFPVGMMNEVIRTRNALTPYIGKDGVRTPYNFKRHAIQNCLYGVDIDPGAVEIAKLRLWLSLIVDEEERETIQPLPNLDYKIVRGNSLQSVGKNLFNQQLFTELEQLKPLYFNETSARKKQEYKQRIDNLINKITNGHKDFDFEIYFSEVFHEKKGFDVVIANPPYVKEYVNKSAFDGLRNSPYYQGKMDLWYLFACRGIDLSKNDSGVVTFIAQNNWVTSHGASKMRNKVIVDAQILSLIDFGNFKIFEAGIQTMIMIFKKTTTPDSYLFDYRRIQGNDLELKDVISVLDKEDSVKAEYLTPTITRTNFIGRTLTFSNSEIELILKKISSKSNFRLDSNKEVAQGIVCPQDFVNKASQEKLGAKHQIGTGIFVLTTKELKSLDLSKKESSLIKPFYTTKELHKWYGSPLNKRSVIYTDSSFRDKSKIKEYPKIKEHLDKFSGAITSDNRPYGLHRAREESFFKGEKIIVARKCQQPNFTYTDFDSYVSATFYVIKTKRVNNKYLTALLNSKLIALWLWHKGKVQGNNYQIDKEPILELPLIEVNEVEQKKIIDIVDKILAITKTEDYFQNSTKQVEVREYEKQIDQLVYKLYGLTPEEIKIVENGK